MATEQIKDTLSMSDETDETLVADAKNGNADAFGRLVKKYERYVGTLALSVVRNREDAFDVSQESFLKAWHHISEFDGKCSFSSWLYRITKNTAYDHLRSSKRRASVPLETTDDDGETASLDIPDENESTRPESAALKREEKKVLYDAIESLEDEHREIILMRDIGEMTYDEIAKRLDLELGTVKSRLFRARKALREELLRRHYF